MKEYLQSLVRAALSPAHGRNVAREYVQARILGSLQRAGAMVPLAFHGGTALRFLYGIIRYSEDLDFTLERPGTRYDFRAYLKSIRSEFQAENYVVELKVNDRKTVHSGFVRFPGLLHELGLSPHQDEVIAVKIEVDTKPPDGVGLTTSVIRKYETFQLQHHDRASLLAGKLHAILQRPYVKGRDIYDLLWYLGDPVWPAPNLTLLRHALEQTGWSGPRLTDENWRGIVRDRLASISWEHIVADVNPFLEPNADPNILTRENVMRVLHVTPMR